MFTRKDRDSVIVVITEHCMQLARMQQQEGGVLAIDNFREVPPNDEEAVLAWVRESYPEFKSGYLPGYCTFYPHDRLVLREAVNTRRLSEPAYLPGIVAEHAKVPNPKEWHVHMLNVSDGVPLTADSPQRSGLVVGVSMAAVRETQQRLKRLSIRPRRLELGTLTTLGALNRHVDQGGYPDGVAVCEIARNQTRLYLIGKDGIHTPPALPHGLLSIEEAVMKEIAAPDIASTAREIENPSEALLTHSRRLVRMISRHLRPAIDYFEMQTGQRIGALYCGHLPHRLAWLEDALGKGVDLDPMPLDLVPWGATVGLQIQGVPERAPNSWLPLLSVVAQLSPATAAPAAPAAAPADNG